MDHDPELYNPWNRRRRRRGGGGGTMMQKASQRRPVPWGSRHKEGGRANEEGGQGQDAGSRVKESGCRAQDPGPAPDTARSNGPCEARRHRLRGGSRVSNVQWRDMNSSMCPWFKSEDPSLSINNVEKVKSAKYNQEIIAEADVCCRPSCIWGQYCSLYVNLIQHNSHRQPIWNARVSICGSILFKTSFCQWMRADSITNMENNKESNVSLKEWHVCSPYDGPRWYIAACGLTTCSLSLSPHATPRLLTVPLSPMPSLPE